MFFSTLQEKNHPDVRLCLSKNHCRPAPLYVMSCCWLIVIVVCLFGGIIVFGTFCFSICFPWQRCVLASLVCFGTPQSTHHHQVTIDLVLPREAKRRWTREGFVGVWLDREVSGRPNVGLALILFIQNSGDIVSFIFCCIGCFNLFFRVIIRNSDAIIDIRIVLLLDLWRKKNNFLFLFTAF